MKFLVHHLWRQFRADPSVVLTLAVVVALVAFLATGLPRLLVDAESRQAQFDIQSASALQLDPAARVPSGASLLSLSEGGSSGGGIVIRDGELVHEPDWDAAYAAVDDLREGQPEPLRSRLGGGAVVTESLSTQLRPASADDPVQHMNAVMRTDPRFEERVELVRGTWPESSPSDWMVGLFDDIGDFQGVSSDISQTPPIEVLIHDDAIEMLGWDVGETREILDRAYLQIVGTYRPLDPADSYWRHISYAAEPYLLLHPDRGPIATFSLYLDPSWGADIPGRYNMLEMGASAAWIWYEFDAPGVTAADLEVLEAQSRALVATAAVLGDGENGLEVRAQFDSSAPEVFAESGSRIDTVRGLLVLLAAGPLAIAVAVFGLGVRLVVERRQKALTQLVGRGASMTQLAGSAAVEGVVVAIPAALAGAALAVWATPGRMTLAQLVPAAVVGILPMLMLCLSTARAARAGGSRQDLGTGGGRWRIVGEGLVVLAAAAAVMAMFRSGAEASDLSAVTAPVALTALGVVIALRIYPLPVRLAERFAARGRGVSQFVGLARARRSPSGGLLPVISLVVGVSVAVLSTVLWSTVEVGARETAWQRLGAEVRVAGPVVSSELESLDGIDRVATVGDLNLQPLRFEGAQTPVEMISVDTEAMREIQAGAPGIDEVPGELAQLADGKLPVLVSPLVDVPVGSDVTIRGVEAVIIGSVERLGGVPFGGGTVVVDRSLWTDVSGEGVLPRIAMVDGDPEAVAAALPSGVVQTPRDVGSDFVASPLGSAMRTALVGGVMLAALLVALTLVLVQILDAPARARVTAVLRTMGVTPGEVRRMTAATMMPTVGVSLLVGLAMGVTLPWIIAAATDLRPLTGSQFQPDPVYEAVAVGGIVTGIVAVMAIAVLLAARSAGRLSLARELRSVDS